MHVQRGAATRIHNPGPGGYTADTRGYTGRYTATGYTPDTQRPTPDQKNMTQAFMCYVLDPAAAKGFEPFLCQTLQNKFPSFTS